MEEILDQGAPVEWSCGTLDGKPILVLQATGPSLTARFFSVPLSVVQVKYVFDNDKLPALEPSTVVVYTTDLLSPILACDPDPLLKPLIDAVVRKEPWVLALQGVVEGQQVTRVVYVKDGVGQEFQSLVPRWILRMT
jgi:hypothetical protein